jgi:exopolyphosphatase/guanosine-5'-triphosphate,3'-diphosphate pyrophosphatase
MAPPNYAALDLGTNTFRLLIARPEPTARLGYAPVHVERVITRAGGGFSPEKGMGPDALSRALSCLQSFQKAMDKAGVAAYRATGTSVFRRAVNQTEVLAAIERETGIGVEIIPGHEEADLSARGAVSQVTVADAAVIFDIGGGSTEYIVWFDGKVQARESFEFGVVRLSEDVLRSDPPAPAELQQMAAAVVPLIREATEKAKAVLGRRPFTLVGTAGTVSTLGAIDLGLSVYDREKINGHRLPASFVGENFDRFASLPRARRLEVAGLEAGREDLIVPGCFIARETMASLGVDKLLVSEGGLLEGVLVDLMRREETRRTLH